MNFNIYDHKNMTGKELKELRERAGISSQEQLAELLDVHKNTIYNYENSDKINPKKANKIIKVIEDFVIKQKHDHKNNMSLNNIVINEPLEFFNTKAGSKYEEMPGGKYKLTVPFVPVRAQATYVMEHTDADFLSSLEEVTFIVDRVGKGNYVAFEIQNDSMNDGTIRSIPDGTIVLARELGRQHWKSKFRVREFPFWIIVHKSTVLCKEIIEHDVENGTITCHSLNDSPEYSDFTLHLNDVRQLFNIVKRQLP